TYGAVDSAAIMVELKSEIKPDRKKDVDPAANAKETKAYGKLPLYFIKNDGQVDEKVEYYVKGAGGGGYTIYFTHEGVFFSLYQTEKPELKPGELKDAAPEKTEITKSEFFNLSLVDSNKKAKIIGEKEQAGKVNYFVGSDKSKWRSNVPTFAAVLYEEVYKGIDVRFYGKGRLLEYDVIVKPGADPDKVKFIYEGIKGLRVTENGELQVGLKEALLVQKKPFIYQEIDGKRAEVEGSFVIEDDTTYGFELASYDKTKELVIDPVLDYSTFLGGTGTDFGYAIAVDSFGAVYVTGATISTVFPTVSPYDSSLNDGVVTDKYDVFVTKINAAGDTVFYSTYLGGNENDVGSGIAVDSRGRAYVTGYTDSTDYPTVSPIYGDNTGTDAFVTKLDAVYGSVVYSTYLGGTGSDLGNGIAVDSSGAAYVVGHTYSTDFPTESPIYATNSGASDVFVTKINSTGTAPLVYSTYLGGSSNDINPNIALDNRGRAYVTGYTTSTDFPTLSAFDNSLNDGVDTTSSDVFVTRINEQGGALLYSTYLGGTSNEHYPDIAVDSLNDVYVTGWTESTDFPTPSAFQGSNAGGSDAFVTKIDSSSSTLVYSTYLGGSDSDLSRGIAVDCSGAAYVTGYTWSTDFPTASAIYGDNTSVDAFVTKIDPDGLALAYSTYLGGTGYDTAYDIAVDGAGAAYVTGETYSSDFPISSAIDSSFASPADAFVSKIGPELLIDAASLSFGLVGTFYSAYVLTSGGDGSYTFSVSSGSLPTGLGLDPSSGLISGISSSPGSTGFTIQVTDGNGDIDTQAYTLIVFSSIMLEYSTYLGGTGTDSGHGIAVDQDGAAYITGITDSTNFPTELPIFGDNTDSDVFVTKIEVDDVDGPFLVYSTYLGGTGVDYGYDIAVDNSGRAYVTGQTFSTDFPNVMAIYSSFGGGTSDAFVTKLNAAGSAIAYSTYLGGTGADSGKGIAVGCFGAAYVTGFTGSTDFPNVKAIDNSLGGSSDAFVTKIDAAGFVVVYSTYLGGASTESGAGIAVDSSGAAYVTG
ncbi:MAG: SBBP repeat-containing protein, partial [Thermodesulfobacteriota bacterium]